MSRSSDVLEVPVGAAFDGPANVFLKRYLYDRLEQRVKQAFRGTLIGKSRARREYEFLTEMRRRNVPTIRPIAYGDNYGRAFLHASFLITEGADGFQSLDLFALDAIRRKTMSRSQRRELTRGFAVTIRKMHDAGIRHGGLFWRNVLVRVDTNGGYEFLLIDPDTHGRLNMSRVPESGVVADLSELVASGIALGQRGLVGFMKAYFGVSRLTANQQKLTSQVLQAARGLAPSEHRRMAVTEAIGWLRARSSGSGRTFDSVDNFFGWICSGPAGSTRIAQGSMAILFSFSEANGAFDRTTIVDSERVTMSSSPSTTHDLVIRTDPETWVSIVSGHADAFSRLRAGRLNMKGEPSALCALMEHLDRKESAMNSTEAEVTMDAEANSASSVGSSVSETSQQTDERNFGHKYKIDDYARYYSEKHASSLGRRISNSIERRMIRRSLLRIKQHQSFASVLDCPSGTGRFLPTLASFGISVIVMDTSGAVLREGRKHHSLFKVPPMELVGSALGIALPDDAVDVVLCSRLLHHLADREDRMMALREFARVARVGVVFSFFDSASYRAWKRARKVRRTGKTGGRHSMSRTAAVEEAVEAGLKPLGMNALFRFHTEITAAAFLC